MSDLRDTPIERAAALLEERFLADQKVVAPELASHLRAMTGFRNIAVHDYERLDRAVLKGILRERVGDLAAFADAVRAFVGV